MLPIFYWDRNLPASLNGRNTAFAAVVNPDCVYPLAVAAQELYEGGVKFKLLMLQLIAVAVAFAAVLLFNQPLIMVFVGIAMVGVQIMQFSKPFKRWLEIRGHEITIQAAKTIYGVSEIRLRNSEADILSKFYSEFKGIHPSDIIIKMDAARSFAAKWVNSNLKKLQSL